MGDSKYYAIVVTCDADARRQSQLAAYLASRREHTMTLAEFVREAVDAPATTVSTDLEGYRERGLTRDHAASVFGAAGRNEVKSPQKCPPVLCCLLPCLNATPTMKAYLHNRPETATVTRGGKRFLIDSTNLVVGDLVTVFEGDIVPADVRVLEVQKTPLEADVAVLFNKPETRYRPVTQRYSAQSDPPDTSIVDSRRVMFCGSKVTSGTAVCIVTATGAATLWSSMIAMDRWPFQ